MPHNLIRGSTRLQQQHGGKAYEYPWCALDKLDGHVRSLIEWRHRCRKVNFVGSLVKRSYLEYVYSEDDERNCLSRKRKTYNPGIFKCYKSYAAKDIKEKGIGKAARAFPINNSHITLLYLDISLYL
jgi:hypothetical protein